MMGFFLISFMAFGPMKLGSGFKPSKKPLPHQFFLPAEQDPMWGQDKVYHFAVSFILCTTFMALSDIDERKAFSVTVGIGILKELYDWGVKRTGFSLRDLTYDLLGAASASSFGKPISNFEN